MKKINLKAITLIELIIVIAIMAIIVLSINTFSLKSSQDYQKLGIFKNEIRTNIESIISKSLMGKAIDGNLEVPTKWEINISTGKLSTYYFTGTTTTGELYKEIIPKTNFSINNINCKNINGNETSDSNNNVILIIKEGNLSLSGCDNQTDKLINFELKYKNKFPKKIEINTITNIINEK